jgi:hypothetical protein
MSQPTNDREEFLEARRLDVQWRPQGGIRLERLQTFGCGLGAEFVYCYTYPTCIENAELKGEKKFRVKVGKADSDPIARIHQQIAASTTAISEPPIVLVIFQTLASRHLERWFHSRLEKATGSIGSEWFVSCEDELVEFYKLYLATAKSTNQSEQILPPWPDSGSDVVRHEAILPPAIGGKTIDGFAVTHRDGTLLSYELQLVHLMWANMLEPISVEELRSRVAAKLGMPPDSVPAKFDQQIAIELGKTGRRPRFQLNMENKLVLVPGAKMPRARTAKFDGSQRYD